MFKMSFGVPARSCPSRERKLEISGRRKTNRRPIELFLDETCDYFKPGDLEEIEDTIITVRERPYLWERK